jgi:hypothetical protein
MLKSAPLICGVHLKSRYSPDLVFSHAEAVAHVGRAAVEDVNGVVAERQLVDVPVGCRMGWEGMGWDGMGREGMKIG